MMNKFTFVCCLAGSLTLSTYAEVGEKITSIDDLSNDKCYTITPRENARGTWYYNASDPAYLYSTGKINVAVNQTDPNQQFAFIKSSSGKYYIYNVGGKKFLAYSGGKVALLDKLITSDSYTTFEASTGTQEENEAYPWVVSLNGKHVGISNGYDYGVITSYQSTNDKGNCISITEAADFNSDEALKQINTFEAAYTEENIQLAAEANKYLSIPQYVVGGYDPVLWGALNAACGNDGVADVYDVTSEDFQSALDNLKASEMTEAKLSNDKVYKIVNRVSSNGYLLSRTEENQSRIFSSTKKSTLPIIENSDKWQVYNLYGYTVLYNKGTKTFAKYHNETIKDDQNKDQKIEQWELTAAKTSVSIQNNPTKANWAFTIQDNAYTGQYHKMHINNDVSETGVVGWETGADATNFYFIELPGETPDNIDLSAEVLPSLKTEAQEILNSNEGTEGKENYIGYMDPAKIEALQALMAQESPESEALYNAINDAKASAKKPESNKYYYIQSTMAFNDGEIKGIYENPDGTNIAWNTTTQSPSELWQFEEDEAGNYYIKSANTGKYLQLELTEEGNPAPFATMQDDKVSSFTLKKTGNNITLGIVNSNGNTTLALQNQNTWGSLASADDVSGNYVGTYNVFEASKPTQWNIIEANTVNVNISENKYATLWLPYAVNLNGTNVEAYTIDQIKDGIATLKGIDGNILPAKSAVILHAEQGAYDLAIEINDGQSSIESSLQGTSIATNVDANTNAYVLGNGTKGIGFYQMSEDDRTLAANKAYLVLPQETKGIRSIIFSDGTTTGIENTVAEGAEAEEYYDLQGRRVMNPTKGIYVTKSGKKVLFNK